MVACCRRTIPPIAIRAIAPLVKWPNHCSRRSDRLRAAVDVSVDVVDVVVDAGELDRDDEGDGVDRATWGDGDSGG